MGADEKKPEQETVTIAPCPLCAQSHTYPATIHYTRVTYLKAPPPHEVTKLFTCPVKNATFESVLRVSGMVEGITVTGAGTTS